MSSDSETEKRTRVCTFRPTPEVARLLDGAMAATGRKLASLVNEGLELGLPLVAEAMAARSREWIKAQGAGAQARVAARRRRREGGS